MIIIVGEGGRITNAYSLQTTKAAASMTSPPNPSIPEHYSSQLAVHLDGVLASGD